MLKMSDARLLTPHPYVTGPYLRAHLRAPPPSLPRTHQSFLCPNKVAISHLYCVLRIDPVFHDQVNRETYQSYVLTHQSQLSSGTVAL